MTPLVRAAVRELLHRAGVALGRGDLATATRLTMTALAGLERHANAPTNATAVGKTVADTIAAVTAALADRPVRRPKTTRRAPRARLTGDTE